MHLPPPESLPRGTLVGPAILPLATLALASTIAAVAWLRSRGARHRLRRTALWAAAGTAAFLAGARGLAWVLPVVHEGRLVLRAEGAPGAHAFVGDLDLGALPLTLDLDAAFEIGRSTGPRPDAPPTHVSSSRDTARAFERRIESWPTSDGASRFHLEERDGARSRSSWFDLTVVDAAGRSLILVGSGGGSESLLNREREVIELHFAPPR